MLVQCGHRDVRSATGVSVTPDQLCRQLQALLAQPGTQVAGIGIAVPGLVDQQGVVAACDMLPCFNGWSADAASRVLGVPVLLVNDVQAALHEEMFDAPIGITAGVAMAGTAVGAAFLVNGQPLRGVSGWAGELGYLPVALGIDPDRGIDVAAPVHRLDELAGGSFMAARCGVSAARLAELAGHADAAAQATARQHSLPPASY